jgi:hypothetical protein
MLNLERFEESVGDDSDDMNIDVHRDLDQGKDGTTITGKEEGQNSERANPSMAGVCNANDPSVSAQSLKNDMHAGTANVARGKQERAVEGLEPIPQGEMVAADRASHDGSMSWSLNGSREGQLEPFDTMEASTLATRSYCESLDISLIGAAPG